MTSGANLAKFLLALQRTPNVSSPQALQWFSTVKDLHLVIVGLLVDMKFVCAGLLSLPLAKCQFFSLLRAAGASETLQLVQNLTLKVQFQLTVELLESLGLQGPNTFNSSLININVQIHRRENLRVLGRLM